MSTTIRKVAIAGATGSLGKPVTAALVRAGFDVTILTRNAAKANAPAGTHAVTVDYTSEESLKKALIGQDALVSTLSSNTPGEQDLLFDVAIAVGIKRVIPSEFGSDTLSPTSRALPVFAPKVALQDHIKEKIAGTSTTYTLVLNNAFLDWGLQHDFVFNRKAKTVTYWDGGDVPFTATPLDTIGDAVAGVLKHPAETANRAVKVYGMTTTQKELVQAYQKHTTADGWHESYVGSKEALPKAYEVLKSDPSNFFAWGFPMLYSVAIAEGADNNWEHSNDNELLGVKETTPAEFDAYVKAAVL